MTVFFFLRLGCAREETCESVWPPSASLYSSSTCYYMNSDPDSLRRRANARNVSFRISLRWPIQIINPGDKIQLHESPFGQGFRRFWEVWFLAACNIFFNDFFGVIECFGYILLLLFLCLEIKRYSDAWDCAASKTLIETAIIAMITVITALR